MSNSLPRYATALALCVVWPLVALAKPPQQADRDALRKALLEILQRQPLSGSRSAVEVKSLDTGEVIFQQDADELLNPASNVKLFTAAAALSRLGPEFRFQTEFLADKDLGPDGKVKTLWVKGKGDPLLNTEVLYEIVSELHHFGLREVGNIVIDDSYFDDQKNPPGYEQDDSDRAYMAPTGAVSFNLNTVGVYLRPGTPGGKAVVELEPPSDYFIIENHSVTTKRGRYRRFSVKSEPAGSRQKIVIHGTLSTEKGAVSVWKKIDNPSMYFGDSLKAMLTQRGIKVRGRVKLGPAPKNAHAIYVHQSPTFDIVLKRMDKMSSNFIAEQLVKTLGAEIKGQPGTTENGVEVIEEFLEGAGIPRGTYVLKNGSGLNDTNRFSARQITKLLAYMYQRFPVAPEYLSSMGIAAKDGTLRYRFDGSEAAGRLRAKTGTLYNVCALSGYVQSVGGEKFAFSMLINDYPGNHGDVIRGLDALGTAVAASGSAQGPALAVAKLTGPAQDDPDGQAEARIKTYLALAKQSDRRNLDFLRTAWRTEKDPAVRAVVAEAIYQSNPQDYFGARALLESFASSDRVYGRLRMLSRALKVDVPAVGSMVELAAQGNQEAIARVLDLAPSADGDDAAQTDLSQALAEIARTAPEELVAGLKAASPKDQAAAEALLARGLGNEAANHPFWPAAKKLQGSSDGATATFTKALVEKLSAAIAEAKLPKAVAASPVAVPAGHVVPASAKQPAQGGQTAEVRPGG